ncbi:unnamed protein product [Cyclocybe aegerita]|uniref:F-box domain-containing protein n=1 Tax=Cyclocybe aegerita TaxID=1973307 RepID=A0A8S0WH57_CYCAE|nr:unnamed protein product [Cyclocybe aegerita]
MHMICTFAYQRLPDDILVSIVEVLGHEGDHRTLKACTLMSRSTLHFCRKYLFRSFDMRSRWNQHVQEAMIPQFYDFLTRHPHLVRYIRIAYFMDKTLVKCIVNCLQLPPLLRLCTSISNFGLEISNGLTTWLTLSYDLRGAILEMISRPHFTSLRFSGLDSIPIDILARCRSLRCLDIEDSVGFPDSSIESCVHRFPLVQLRELIVKDSQPFLSSLLNAQGIVDLSRIETLTFGMEFEYSVQDCWNLIYTCAKDLKSLKFIAKSPSYVDHFLLSEYPPALQPFITLSPLMHLQSLSFSIFLLEDVVGDLEPDEFLKPLCLLLRTSVSTIQEVSISLCLDSFEIFGNNEDRQWMTSGTDADGVAVNFFSELDTTLSDTRLLPRLAQVELTIFILDLDSDDDEDYNTHSDDGWDSDDSLGRWEKNEFLVPDGVVRNSKKMLGETQRRLGDGLRVALLDIP